MKGGKKVKEMGMYEPVIWFIVLATVLMLLTLAPIIMSLWIEEFLKWHRNRKGERQKQDSNNQPE